MQNASAVRSSRLRDWSSVAPVLSDSSSAEAQHVLDGNRLSQHGENCSLQSYSFS